MGNIVTTTNVPVEAPAGEPAGEPKNTTQETAPADKEAVASTEVAEKTTEAEPGTSTEVEADADDDDEGGEDGSSSKAEVPKGVRKKFSKLTGEIAWLREQLQRATERESVTVAPKVETSPGDSEPAESDYESYVDYMSARAEWMAEKKVKALLQTDRNDRALAERQAEFMKRLAPFKAEFKDFQATIDSVPKDVIVSPEFSQCIETSELGPLVGYTLAKNHQELRRVMALPPVLQILEFARLEQKLSAERTGTANVEPEKKVQRSSAPPPAETLDKGSSVVSLSSKEVAGDYMKWKKVREAERKAKG